MEKEENLGFGQACKRFRLQSVSFNSGVIPHSIEGLMELMIKDFRLTHIVGTVKEDEDADMLFFEYGTHKCENKGTRFCLSLKRQVILTDDGGGYYGFTAYFNLDKVNLTHFYLEWCGEKDELARWLRRVKTSEGYRKIKELIPERLDIEVENS